MKAQELAEKIQNTINEIIPEGFVKVQYSSNLIQAITIYFASKKEWTNNIIQNDPAYTILHVYGDKNPKNNGQDQDDLLDSNSNDGNVVDTIRLEGNVCGRIFLKDYSKVKILFRKKTGSVDYILNYIDNYFTRLKIELDKAVKEGKL